MFNEKGNDSPIFIVGARVTDPAEHILVLTILGLYQPSRVRSCPTEEAFFYYSSDASTGYVVYVYDGHSDARIRGLFNSLTFTHSGLTKILAYNEDEWVLGGDKDFGNDFLLGFSDQYQGADFTRKIRNVIGPAESEWLDSSSDDNSVIPPALVPLQSADRGLPGGVRYPVVKSCLDATQKALIRAHFDDRDRYILPPGKLESLCPHLEACEDCCLDILKDVSLVTNEVQTAYELDAGRFGQKASPYESTVYALSREDRLHE